MPIHRGCVVPIGTNPKERGTFWCRGYRPSGALIFRWTYDRDGNRHDQFLRSRGTKAYHFGVSPPECIWLGCFTCRSPQERYRYSRTSYTTIPWPEPTPNSAPPSKSAAQAVLDERARHPTPHSPTSTTRSPCHRSRSIAHHALDRAVDAASAKTNFASAAERVAFYPLSTKTPSSSPPRRSIRKTPAPRKPPGAPFDARTQSQTLSRTISQPLHLKRVD